MKFVLYNVCPEFGRPEMGDEVVRDLPVTSRTVPGLLSVEQAKDPL